MEIKFDIKTKLPTLNEYIGLGRANKYKQALIKNTFTDICGNYAIPIKNKIDKNKCYSLILNWEVTNNRSDPDNIYFGVKFILDGMVKRGILKNDGRKNIRNISNTIKTTKKFNLEVNLIEE